MNVCVQEPGRDAAAAVFNSGSKQQLCDFTDCKDSKVVHNNSMQMQHKHTERENTAQVYNFSWKQETACVFHLCTCWLNRLLHALNVCNLSAYVCIYIIHANSCNNLPYRNWIKSPLHLKQLTISSEEDRSGWNTDPKFFSSCCAHMRLK